MDDFLSPNFRFTTILENTWVPRIPQNSIKTRVVITVPCKYAAKAHQFTWGVIAILLVSTEPFFLIVYSFVLTKFSMGHLEAFARRSADKYSEMKVHQGIHLSY